MAGSATPLFAGSNPAQCSINICMLVDWHRFPYHAIVPWPNHEYQQDWVNSLLVVEDWLKQCVGARYAAWAYADCAVLYNIGVAFKWDQDRTLFVLAWSET